MISARPLVSLVLAAALATAAAACGGTGEEASPSTGVDQLLDQTFSGDQRVESGRLDLTVRLDGRAALGAPVDARLSGPFEVEDPRVLPRFALDAELQGGGQRLRAGAVSTGDAGYVSFQGTDYVVSDLVFRQFKAGYEEAQKHGQGASGQSFASLGMDPRRWLTNARNAGDGKVGDTDTIRITGDVDVAALLDDVDAALARARSLGLQGAGRLPERLTAEQRRRIQQAVDDLRVEIHTGRDDSILRRMRVELAVADPAAGSGTLVLDLSLTDVNEDQEIAAPGDAKPFSELLQQLEVLGFALGGGGNGGSGGGGAVPGGAALERYSDCITDAGADADAARKCAELLTP